MTWYICVDNFFPNCHTRGYEECSLVDGLLIVAISKVAWLLFSCFDDEIKNQRYSLVSKLPEDIKTSFQVCD